MVRPLRADAEDPPWRIRQRGAPSPARAIRLLRGWWRSWTRWALRVFGGGEARSVPTTPEAQAALTRLLIAQADAPPAPPPGAWTAVGAREAVIAAEAERRLLVSAGAPSSVMDRLRPPPSPPPVTMAGGGVHAGPIEIPIQTGPLVRGIEGRVLQEWATEGAQLIRSVPPELLADLPAAIVEAASQGKTWGALRNVLRAKVGHVGEARLELIARDQTAKLNSRITEAMHSAAGVTHYRWRANHDSRVRRIHLEADGHVLAWASEGWPGAGFYGRPAHAGRGGQCRCTAEPVPPEDW